MGGNRERHGTGISRLLVGVRALALPVHSTVPYIHVILPKMDCIIYNTIKT